MLQLKLAAGAAVAAMVGWSAFVYRERSNIPLGRRRKFSPGSADDLLVNRVRPGDLVLFSRDCGLYLPAGASLCAATKRVGGTEYDHAGVVVFHRGEPHIAEDTFTETKLRPFDERVICSRASEILIRPLKVPLSREEERAMTEAALKRVGTKAPIEPVTFITAAVTSNPKEALLRAPAALVSDLYRAAGVFREDASCTITELEPRFEPQAFRAGQGFGTEFWFRDKRG